MEKESATLPPVLIESILKSTPDPLRVRETTAAVISDLNLVTIRGEKLSPLAELLKERVKDQALLTEAQFGISQPSPQRIFILDTVNFCFWAEANQEKWTVEYPQGKFKDGWEALTACFDRALEEQIPLLDANFLEKLTLSDTQHIFRGSNQTEIPLLEERWHFLRESGQILNQRFGGLFENLIKESGFKAPVIAQTIIYWFSSFRDTSYWQGKPVNFFKRAQICAYDLSLLPQLNINGIDQLTIFADYKLPQLLRSYGLLHYQRPLVKKIDNLELIDQDSQEEVEIRAAVIWAGELLAHRLKLTPALVDNALWNLATQTKRQMKPYHRTRTTNY